MKVYYIWIVFILLLIACLEKTEDQGELVAQVYNKRLYESQLEKILPEEVSREDSLLLSNAYIENWIRESLMMNEAEKNIPADLEIDKLVEDYRSSLIMHSYEKRLVENLLDSIIQEEELLAYYEENKSQYILESTIFRIFLIKVEKDSITGEENDRLGELWELGVDKGEENAMSRLSGFCNERGIYAILDSSIWYKVDDIASQLPRGSINAELIKYTTEFQFDDDQYYYFLKVFENKGKKEVSPLSYIRDQATKVILHKRKSELLKKIKEELYERASSANRIKLFIQ